MTTYYGIGVMSGPSLDGLDLCFCEFTGDSQTDIWGYRIEQAVTVPYIKPMKDRLKNATSMTGLELAKLNSDWSHFVGQCLEKFTKDKNIRPDFVSSHGHTVFHQPGISLNFQLGNGQIIASYVKCPFVCDFRSKDMALGGQASPLVACGEKFLFQQTDICITLAGIAKVGFRGQNGYEVCPCNVLLNHLAAQHDPEWTQDTDGQLAAQGRVIPDVLSRLDQLMFYQQIGPRSFGNQWVETEVLPLLKTELYSVPDLMRTCVEHICVHVEKACAKGILKRGSTAMVTGGSVFNTTLMTALRAKLTAHHIRVVDTEHEIVEYKEALVFAFLGLRCLLGMENVFCSVTGSKSDSVSGSIHHGCNTYDPCRLQRWYNFLERRKSTDTAGTLNH